jgi:chromosome partitioning protein
VAGIRKGAKMNVIAVFNQKGGVGKTTISVNLAVALASIGYETVFIDMDFQGDGTRQLWHEDSPKLTVYDLLARRCCAEEAAVPTGIPHLSVVASSRKLSLIEAGADMAGGRQTELKANGFTRGQIDFVVLDCPPSLGRLAANALNAADVLLVPVTPTPYAIEGMKRTLDIYKAVRDGLNPNLRRYHICLSMMDDKALSRMLADEIAAAQKGHLLPTRIPLDADVNKAATYRMPAMLYNPQSGFAQAAGSLALDLIETLGGALPDGAAQGMRERIGAKHRELAATFRNVAERNVEIATPVVPANEAPPPAHHNGHAADGQRSVRALGARVQPFVVGSILGAAVGFLTGAQM